MESETKICQNCKNEFVVEPDDFDFYEKMKVPPPTWCPECRLRRRLAVRNERILYKDNCDMCGKEMLSMYSSASKFKIYCKACWWSDKWDAINCGLSYDSSSNLFDQLKILQNSVPHQNFLHINAENCEFANFIRDGKGIYLSFSMVSSENCFYCKNVDNSKEVLDSFDATNSNFCYGIINGNRNYKCMFLESSDNCMDSAFLYDCLNCQNCFMCSNLRGKAYHFLNKPVTKDEYKNLIGNLTASNSELQKLILQFEELKLSSLHKFSRMVNCSSSTGHEISNARNAQVSFNAYDLENVKNVFRCIRIKDCHDGDYVGKSELVYEACSGGMENSQRLRLSMHGMDSLIDVTYTDSCTNSSYLFACVGLRNKQYCILNKQYTKEEYEELVPKIIKHMSDMPYVDKKGRVYKYGEFFPAELSPFAYNETIAQEYFPLTKEHVIEQGYYWKSPEERDYRITKRSEDLPDNINDVSDSILGDIIQCDHNQTCNESCTQAFRIMREELEFYRRMNLPIPRLCPNCRYYYRLKQRNPLKLWHRQCMCTKNHSYHTGKCHNEFETSYSPDRPEIVYCESCYNSEVV